MRKLCAVVLTAALVSTGALAASSTDRSLAPGKPAGVQNAQSGSQVAAVVGGTAIFAMIAALVSGGGGGSAGAASNPNGTLNTQTSTTSST